MGPSNLNVFLIFSLHIFTGSLASVIKLEKGQYNGIIIGIDGEKVPSTQCKTILDNLNVLVPLFSGNLYEATEQKALIGEVNILLPNNWNATTDCNLNAADVKEAKPNESFKNSDFQITQNHSLADALPWTRQYRPCGQPGDSIVLPISFLGNPNITDSIKAQILLHEWAKFRYGVFDEFAYEQDEHQLFPPCYTYANQGHFTSCSSPPLPAVVQNASVCSLEFLAKYNLDLINKLGDGTTSVMSFPYLQGFTKFCDKGTHNRWAPTKQNLYCKRKSVGEVVFSHSDFVERKNAEIVPNNQDPLPQPKIQYLQHLHSSEYNPAYVIVIEDSQDMREQYKILHVKQAMAQFLEILEDNTKVHLIIFEGDTINHYEKTLKGDDDRAGLLKEIPDISSDGPRDSQKHQRSISQVIDKLLEIFFTEQKNSWHVLLFTDSSPVNTPITDFSEEITKFGRTSHTISIFTFENTTESNSNEWLQWYSIPNTRNVIALPFCFLQNPRGPCTFQTSSFILDQIVGNFNDLQFNMDKPRFIQTWEQVSIPNVAGERNFNLDGDSKMVKRLFLFMTLPAAVDNPSDHIQIIGIDGLCETTNLLGYGHVIKFTGNGCTFKTGQWTLKVIEQVPPGSRPLLLNIFMEMDDVNMSNRLIVTPSLPNTHELLPNQNIYPVYVSLQTEQGYPVLYAHVTLHIFYPNLFTTGNGQDKINGSVIVLQDDGSSNGPDQTGNDGIYSGYLSGFSTVSKIFHLVQVQVTTTPKTLIMQSSIPSKAVLLNDKLTNKCCGKIIHELGYSSFQPPNLKFQMLHFGFKTKEVWSKQLLFPPGSIEKIEVFENDETVVIEFDGVAGDNTGNDTITVTSYQACCVPTNSTESMQTTPDPDENTCKDNSVVCGDIRPPNEKQTCSMNKENLVKLWVPLEDQKLVQLLLCAIRAVNSNGEFGSLSQQFVGVPVTQAIDKLMGEGEPKCENLFDDKCLPFWVFWVLIGCLAGVLLVLLVVICCWCCAARKKRKETRSTVQSGKHPPKPTKENVLAVHYSPHPQQQRQFNHNNRQSSVEDVNVDDHESKVVKEIFVNHAYIQDGDGEIKIIADNGQILRKPKSDNQSPLPPIQENPNMQVFKPVPMPVSKPSRMPRTSDHRTRGRRHDRPQILHSNPMLRSDSSYNSLERQSLAQQQPQPPPPQFIPSTRNTDPALVYATISRTGRLNNQQSSPTQLTFDPHYMVPHNSVPLPLPPQPTSRQLAREVTLSRSPPKVPNYPPPISDSETSTDFDMRRRGGGRRLPPQFTKPPPYPEGSQLVTVTGQQTPASNDSIFRRGIPVQSRPVNPPVPPPRFDRQAAPVNVRTRNNSSGPIKTFSSKQEMISSDEDDSDEWDDGDNYEFQNNTGVSYA